MPPPRKKRKTGRKKPPAPKHKVRLSLDEFKKGRKKCRAHIRSCGKVPAVKPYDPFLSLQHVNLSASTKKVYKANWAEMTRFFYLIGCYQSAMLVDRAVCPSDPLPFRPESFSLYLTYRCAKKGIPLLHPKTGTQIYDVNGKPLVTVGGWSAPSMLYKCHASVWFLHQQVYPETCSGPYVQECSDCARLNLRQFLREQGRDISADLQPFLGKEKEQSESNNVATCNFIMQTCGFYPSCLVHANKPPLISTGNVLEHPVAKNTYEAWLKMKTNQHKVKGCGQLYPTELRMIRTYLLGEGDMASLQLWVMILLGVRLFLRCDELITLRMDNFQDSYWGGSRSDESPPDARLIGSLTKCQVVNESSIESITVEVQGKTDRHPKRLVLLSDYEDTDFDELRTLLWYIKMFNISGGYLFPPPSLLVQQYTVEQSRRPMTSDLHVKYKEFLRRFKFVVYHVVGRDDKFFLVGTHTMRKTAYLLAIWGFYWGMTDVKQDIPCKFSP